MARIVRIQAKIHGYARQGIEHPSRPVDYPAERFSANQLQQLKADPALWVQLLDQGSEVGPREPGKTEMPSKPARGRKKPS